jgi:hypothetical protein
MAVADMLKKHALKHFRSTKNGSSLVKTTGKNLMVTNTEPMVK